MFGCSEEEEEETLRGVNARQESRSSMDASMIEEGENDDEEGALFLSASILPNISQRHNQMSDERAGDGPDFRSVLEEIVRRYFWTNTRITKRVRLALVRLCPKGQIRDDTNRSQTRTLSELCVCLRECVCSVVSLFVPNIL